MRPVFPCPAIVDVGASGDEGRLAVGNTQQACAGTECTADPRRNALPGIFFGRIVKMADQIPQRVRTIEISGQEALHRRVGGLNLPCTRSLVLADARGLVNPASRPD